MSRNGTLTVGCDANAVYSTNDKAAILVAALELPACVNLNTFVAALVKCIGRHAFNCRRIVIYESEPRSRHEAHVQNHLKQALRLLAITRGMELISVNEIQIDALADVCGVNGLPEGWEATIDAHSVETIRRVTLRDDVPFGRVVLPFDRQRFKRRTAFYELTVAAAEERLHWPDYETTREKSNGQPMWLKAMA